MAATETLTLTLTKYKGTSVDTQVADEYIGNVYANNTPEYYRVRLAFTTKKRLKKVTLSLKYYSGTNVNNVDYHCGVYSSCPEKNSTKGNKFTWSSKAATITLTQEFEANTTYYIWVWSPSNSGGFVTLQTWSAVGTVAAPALYVKTVSGWVECEGLYAKNSAGWVECEELYAKNSAGWQES